MITSCGVWGHCLKAFPAAAYAAYAAGRGYSGYPSFGLPYPTVDLTNGQLTPNNNTPLLTQALSVSSSYLPYAVMNNYQAAAAAAHSYGPSASPHAAAANTATRQGFPSTNSPGPTIDMYSSAGADNVGYVQATSPQPSGFPIAVSRAPLNYSPIYSLNFAMANI
ncbi:RNA-binding protein Musashi homolog Rbp6 isoform X2 [Drosophila busckii]|uniref:RNA-binding protein Musashi homolog Rbp6 isoform X2 n=1 Tax=Drosophila busckii TaxID=30019 RepID=UPI001432B2DF|nr:RNA-binding protein Musashi homolog Rbp6 isoform X2 [Drosophila busckii]